MIWMISANGKIYDHLSAFQKWGFIDWKQRPNYEVGDIVYIYCTKPLQRLMYKTIVERVSLTFSQIVNDREFWYDFTEYEKSLGGKYARLKLVDQVNSDALSLQSLKNHGLKSAPQGPIKVSKNLNTYITKHMNDYDVPGIFPESDIPELAYEGACVQTTVNRYERSSIARNKCIEYHGVTCSVCGFNFEKAYGDIGKDFIHIHHLKPLNEINESYLVNYKNDLIPVCPNCHAMLHRKQNGKLYSIDELRKLLQEE